MDPDESNREGTPTPSDRGPALPGSPQHRAEKNGRATGYAPWVTTAVALIGGLLTVLFVPGVLDSRSGGRTAGPDVVTLLAVGLLLTAFTAAALYFGLRSTLNLPSKVLAYVLAYNGLIVIVKFSLAPRGLYEVNREVAWESVFSLGQTELVLLAAVMVLVLYLTVYGLIYRYYRRRREAASTRRTILSRLEGARTRRGLVVAGLGAVAIWASGAIVFVVAVPLIVASSGVQYLDFVFSSSVSLLIALALAGATTLAARSFGSAAEHASLTRDASAMTTVFWLGLALLAVYHGLWVVYILALATIWPLRVVVPK